MTTKFMLTFIVWHLYHKNATRKFVSSSPNILNYAKCYKTDKHFEVVS